MCFPSIFKAVRILQAVAGADEIGHIFEVGEDMGATSTHGDYVR